MLFLSNTSSPTATVYADFSSWRACLIYPPWTQSSLFLTSPPENYHMTYLQVEFKNKQYKWTYLQNRKRLTDSENKVMVVGGRRMDTCYMYGWVPLLFIWNDHNIVNWLYPSTKSCGSAGKKSARNAGDLGSIPRLGRSPEKGKATWILHSGLENSMDSPQGCKESDTTERLPLSLSIQNEL